MVLGAAVIAANSLSTGVSEFLSSKAHREFIQAEKRRELWEFKNYKDAEIYEVIILCSCCGHDELTGPSKLYMGSHAVAIL